MLSTEAKLAPIHVVAGLIEGPGPQYLLAQRGAHQHLAGCWEFPGGKIEAGESQLDALRRELQEELAISLTEAEPFLSLNYDYPEKTVALHFFRVTQFEGEARGCEGQMLRWVPLAELPGLDLPPANIPVLERLEQYWSPRLSSAE